jgi:hypothetical protein
MTKEPEEWLNSVRFRLNFHYSIPLTIIYFMTVGNQVYEYIDFQAICDFVFAIPNNHKKILICTLIRLIN